MNVYNRIEDEIKNIKDPIIFFNYIINNITTHTKNENILHHEHSFSFDEYLSIYIKFFFKYHHNSAMENNLLKLNSNISNYPLTFNVIKDYYMYISYQLKLIPILYNWKKIYINPFFWKQSINKQINLLLKLKEKFDSQFDSTKGNIYFHIKLKEGYSNTYHIEEMIERLETIYKMFKYNFFDQIKCKVMTRDEFIYMPYDDMVKYVEYIFVKINKILNHYIFNFQIYDFYRSQLENLTNPVEPININIVDVCSEIEIDDINFILN